jgi:mevalonate kinase
MAIEQQNGDCNLYASAATIFNKTASADGQWELDIRIGDGVKNLHTNAATLTLAVTVGGATIGGGSASTAKDAAVLRAALRTGPIFVASGQAITATLRSNNTGDTDVDVTVTPRKILDADNVAAALLDATNGVETGMTLRQTMRIMAAVLSGKISGAGTGVESFVGIDGSTSRVQVTADTAGNRTNVTYTPN